MTSNGATPLPRQGRPDASGRPTPLSREEKIARARELREQGELLREIAAELGVAKATAAEYLNDPDYSKKRARQARYRGVCVDCGCETDGSNGRGHAPKRCQLCAQSNHHAQQRAAAEARYAEVARLYREGLTSWQVAERLGTTARAVASTAHHARVAGFPMPYAPRGWRSHRKVVAA